MDDAFDRYFVFIAEMSQKTGRDFLDLFMHPEELVPYEQVWEMEWIEAQVKTEVTLYTKTGILSVNAVFAVPDDDDDSNYWARVRQAIKKGRYRVEPEFLGKVMSVLIRDNQDLQLRKRVAYPSMGGRYLGGEEIPTVQTKIVKRKESKPFWLVQLTDVQIVIGELINTPGFKRYDLRFSGASSLVDNRPADAA